MYIVDLKIIKPYTDGPDQDMYYGTISCDTGGNKHVEKIEVRDSDEENLKTLLKTIADALNEVKDSAAPEKKIDPYDHAMDII